MSTTTGARAASRRVGGGPVRPGSPALLTLVAGGVHPLDRLVDPDQTSREGDVDDLDEGLLALTLDVVEGDADRELGVLVEGQQLLEVRLLRPGDGRGVRLDAALAVARAHPEGDHLRRRDC